MSDGYTVAASGPGHLGQKSIPHLAGGFFQCKMVAGPVGFDITPLDSNGHLKLAGQLFHIPGISRRISPAQLMVKVSNIKLEIKLVLQPD
jgi:hypothetical protein